MAKGNHKFKKTQQYHFGKLKSGHQVAFLRTPKKQVLSGADLIERGITTFAQYYKINPSNYKVGETISICTQDENGLFKKEMSKTILEPLNPESLSDGQPSLDTHGNSNINERLDQAYKTQITQLQNQLHEAERLKNEYQRQVIEKTTELAELEVDHQNLVEKHDDMKEEFKEFKKEFGDIIKEARNPAPSTLGDKLGDLVTQPEAMAVLTDLGAGLASWVKQKVNTAPPTPYGLNDAAPTHTEQGPTIKDDEAEVFNEG